MDRRIVWWLALAAAVSTSYVDAKIRHQTQSGNVAARDADDPVPEPLIMTCDGHQVYVKLPMSRINKQRPFGKRRFIVGNNANATECMGTEIENGTYLEYTFPTKSCFPLIRESDTNITFEYSMTFEDFIDPDEELGISRERVFAIDLECLFLRGKKNLTQFYLPSYSMVSVHKEDLGKIDIQMTLEYDNGEPIDDVVPVGDELHAHVEVLSETNLEMYVTSCLASPGRILGNTSHSLIEDGCFNTLDASVGPVGPVDHTAKSYKFKFEAFRFLTQEMNDKLWIICEIALCTDHESLAMCARPSMCSKKRSVDADQEPERIMDRRQAGDEAQTYTLTTGPISIGAAEATPADA